MHSSDQVQRTNYYTSHTGPGTREPRTLRSSTYLGVRETLVLVAEARHRSRTLLHFVCSVPSSQAEESTQARTITHTSDTSTTMELNRHGLRRTVSTIQRVRLPMGSGLPTHVYGPPDTCTYYRHGCRPRVHLRARDRASAWITGVHSLGQRLQVYLKILEGTASTHGHEIAHVHCIPSPDGRHVRTHH